MQAFCDPARIIRPLHGLMSSNAAHSRFEQFLICDPNTTTGHPNGKPVVVILPGFEPGTHSLEGCCSVQLSYGTE